ncbi:MAG: hypothetical protein HQL69_02565 [Magnetococcales bacterium]|nr:hypothetical protein [Magnetococcales bacterium]
MSITELKKFLPKKVKPVKTVLTHKTSSLSVQDFLAENPKAFEFVKQRASAFGSLQQSDLDALTHQILGFIGTKNRESYQRYADLKKTLPVRVTGLLQRMDDAGIVLEMELPPRAGKETMPEVKTLSMRAAIDKHQNQQVERRTEDE